MFRANRRSRFAHGGYPDAMVIDETYGRSLRAACEDGTRRPVVFSDRSRIEQ